MPRIVFLSDTHSFYPDVIVPDGDILIHSGDFGARGRLSELAQFREWMLSHPHQHKFFVAGNHDWCFELEGERAQSEIEGVTYLQDSAVTIMGLTIYGSPWQPRFYDWAFNLDRGEPIAKVWAKIPNGVDILVTHGPAYGILDRTERGLKVGCEDLLLRVRKVKPRLHCFGHIHEGYGVHEEGGTLFVNGSICDARYRPVNKVRVIDVDSDGPARLLI